MNATLGILVSANTAQAEQGLRDFTASIYATGASVSALQKTVTSFGGGVQSFNSTINVTNATLGATRGAAGAASTGLNAASRSFDGVTRGAAASNRQLDAVENSLVEIRGRADNIPPALNRLDRSLQGASRGSNEATQSLMNLGRVAQDAPYGFIGIANNLNPLLESFQRTVAATGSTRSAFAAMGSALTGPAGIGLALSVVSSLLIQFGGNLFGSANRIDQAKVSTDEFKFSLDELSSELERLRNKLDFTNELSKLQNELSGLTGGALALANANDDIKTTATEIAASTTKVAPRVQELNQQRIALQGIADEFDRVKAIADKPLTTTTILKGLPVESANPGVAEARAELSKLKNFGIAAKEFIQFGKVSEEVLDNLNAQQKTQISSAIALSETVSRETEKIGRAQEKQALNALKVKLAEKAAAKDRIDDAKKATDEILAQAKRIQSEFPGFFNVTLDSVLLTDIEKISLSKELIANFQKLRDQEFSRLATGLTDMVVISEPTRIQIEKIELLPPNRKDINVALLVEKFKQFKVPVKLEPVIDANNSALTQQLNDLFKNGFADLFAGVGESLGEMLSGKLSGFSSMFKVLGSLISQLGKVLIQFGIVKLGLDQILKNPIAIPGAVAIALGVAAVAAGSAIRNIQPRAKGGPVKAGQPYLVGEVGAELFVPQASGTIVPNSKLGGIEGVMHQMMAIEIYGRLSGNDILLSNARQTRANGR